MTVTATATATATATTAQKTEQGMLFDLRRKSQIAFCGPLDHVGDVHVQEADFDFERSVFKTVGPEMRPKVKEQFGKAIFWSDAAVANIEEKTAAMLVENPRWAGLKAHNPDLIRFMENDCDFSTEHADGSFMEHLQYCYEYAVAHMPGHSSVPLFLHSIMGVGTNLFPMKLEQRPQLAALVTADDMVHIEAFPTLLRLLLHRPLLDQLLQMSPPELAAIDGLECHRLLGPDIDNRQQSDNHPVHLTAEQFWVQLNYQLIHLMDFLPVEKWETNATEMRSFADLHKVLVRANKLFCKLDFDSEKWSVEAAKKQDAAGDDPALGNTLIKSFSDRIGHSLTYYLVSSSYSLPPHAP